MSTAPSMTSPAVDVISGLTARRLTLQTFDSAASQSGVTVRMLLQRQPRQGLEHKSRLHI